MCNGLCNLQLCLEDGKMQHDSYVNMNEIWERRLSRLHHTGRKIEDCSLQYILRLAAGAVAWKMLRLRYSMNNKICYFGRSAPVSLQPGQLYWLPKGASTHNPGLPSVMQFRVSTPMACVLSRRLDDSGSGTWEVFVIRLFGNKPLFRTQLTASRYTTLVFQHMPPMHTRS